MGVFSCEVSVFSEGIFTERLGVFNGRVSVFSENVGIFRGLVFSVCV